jgi:hypothetical protein
MHDLQRKFKQPLVVGGGFNARIWTAIEDSLRSRKLIENVL